MLHYSVYMKDADRPWITFVHGAGGSSSIWFKQIRFFSKHFNLLLVDLRGHGKSKSFFDTQKLKKYTFKSITKDVIEVLNHEKIEQSHFVGISLGTIIIRQIAEWYPQRVQSMILGGAILKFNLRSRFLMTFGNWTKSHNDFVSNTFWYGLIGGSADAENPSDASAFTNSVAASV